ncbi:class I SAM-dependent methyltransferase [Umezawaea sp.]|uniref:class I SAM-dependent methyltransferase n=1 Tax=Umezawaea sp. TaxID=1955258 RepID=UPI002ED1F709
MARHTHDGIDWPSRLIAMRRADELHADALRVVARRLVRALPDNPTVIDVGSGAGGMSVALTEALCARGGGTVVLVDAVPELLDAATTRARAAASYESDSTTTTVRVRPVLADIATEEPTEFAAAAHLVWASNVLHHLPDQRQGAVNLIGALAPGGWFALAEGGLDTRCLPWDLGVGEPGLQDRLAAARDQWFTRMREQIPDVVRLTAGWNIVLADAGLHDVSAFSYLVDHPAPTKPVVRDSIEDWLRWRHDVTGDLLHPADRAALRTLLDPSDPNYVGLREDVFFLQTNTVHTGQKP